MDFFRSTPSGDAFDHHLRDNCCLVQVNERIAVATGPRGGARPKSIALLLSVMRDGSGRYTFRVRSGKREIATTVNADLAASFHEDLRLLRWKSAGVHDPGDTLLDHVGNRLAGLIGSPEDWRSLKLPEGPKYVRVQFSPETDSLVHLPWELLRINGRFLLHHPGSHLVREISGPRTRRRRRRMAALHISLGTDDALRLDEERCVVLEALPSNMPVDFLLDPSIGHLGTALEVFRPALVIVSGHGSYDDIRHEHYVHTHQGPIPTRRLAEWCAQYGCEILLLSTCEGGRFGGALLDGGSIMPRDVVSFTFPVKSRTATESVQRFLLELGRGCSVSEAMAAVRSIDTDDEFAFFNCVHLHRAKARSLHLPAATRRKNRRIATRCPGMELPLGTLNAFAHWSDVTTLLAPVGGGGDTLIQHWSELVRRSQSQSRRWRILFNPDETAMRARRKQQVVRLAFSSRYFPVERDNVVYTDGISRTLAKAILKERLGAAASKVGDHPLLGMPAFLDSLSVGTSPEEAVLAFEDANEMRERAQRLGPDGHLFAGSLYAQDSIAQTTVEGRKKFAQITQEFGLEAAVIERGILAAVQAGVVLPCGETLTLAPEFMMLGERWFPDWRTEHRRTFETLCAAFGKLAAHGKVDLETGERLLDWAIRIGQWEIAGLLCERLCAWYGTRGRLEDMEQNIRRVLPKVSGMTSFVLRGHLATLLINQGNFRAGLGENETLEQELRALPEDEDYYRNLQATITQQIDCLQELGRLDDAQKRWNEAKRLVPLCPDPTGQLLPRLLGQLAHIRQQAGAVSEALEHATEVVRLAVENNCPAVLVAELRHTKADLLRLSERSRDALDELRACTGTDMPPSLRSRFFHLLSLLVGERGRGESLEYLLESYETDRQRGDAAGVAISLLSIARVFFEQSELDRSRERIREALPLAERCGLQTVIAHLAELWAEIDITEGDVASAKSWLATARDRFARYGDTEEEGRITRILDALTTSRQVRPGT